MWCVKSIYLYNDESPRDTLECDVCIFRTKEEAVKELNRIILEDWTAEVDVDGETKMLADCMGMCEDVGCSPKWSDWYYSEDGTKAWFMYDGTHGYKGEVEEIEIPGEEAATP